jgi:arylsulfatase A-like enzyme
MVRALGAGALGSVPVGLRAGAAGEGLGAALEGWLAATGIVGSILVPVALLCPRAARGLRGVLGREPPRSLGAAVALALGLTALALMALGALLESRTRHGGLGGVAFAIGGLAVACAVVLAATRVVAALNGLVAGGAPPWLPAAVAALPVALAVWLAGGVLLGDAPAAAPARAVVVDLCVTAAAAGLLFGRPRELGDEHPTASRARFWLAGAVVAALVMSAGWWRLERGEARAALRRAGGLASAVQRVLERWTDRDGDGAGAHFGGRDCDEGDPRRRPGVLDVAGDGVDADCDGADGGGLRVALVSTLAAALEPERRAAPQPTLSSVVPAAGGAADGARPAPPDLVLVTLDAVRADRTSAYGYDKATTPALAALARRGVLFRHAYAAGADTQHALMPLVSGRPLSATARTRGEWPTVRREVDTVAERLARAGYATGAVSSFTWLRKDRGFHQGFDDFDESPFRTRHPEREVTGDLAAAAAASLHGRLVQRGRPLFLWVHLFDAHARHLAHPGLDFGRGESGRYDSEVAFVDRQLDALVRAVDASGRAGRTVWLVHGSCGVALEERAGRVRPGALFDEIVRVPLVIVAPGARERIFERDAVSVLDLAPTLLDFAGADGAAVDGVSLRPAVEGEGTFERTAVVVRGARRSAVVDWPLKLVVGDGTRPGPGRADPTLLFDLARDPGEHDDRSGADPDAVARLRAVIGPGPRGL